MRGGVRRLMWRPRKMIKRFRVATKTTIKGNDHQMTVITTSLWMPIRKRARRRRLNGILRTWMNWKSRKKDQRVNQNQKKVSRNFRATRGGRRTTPQQWPSMGGGG